MHSHCCLVAFAFWHLGFEFGAGGWVGGGVEVEGRRGNQNTANGLGSFVSRVTQHNGRILDYYYIICPVSQIIVNCHWSCYKTQTPFGVQPRNAHQNCDVLKFNTVVWCVNPNPLTVGPGQLFY